MAKKEDTKQSPVSVLLHPTLSHNSLPVLPHGTSHAPPSVLRAVPPVSPDVVILPQIYRNPSVLSYIPDLYFDPSYDLFSFHPYSFGFVSLFCIDFCPYDTLKKVQSKDGSLLQNARKCGIFMVLLSQ